MKNKINIIKAAGGIIWKDINKNPKVLIIHRQKYNDWSLPKGKIKHRESLIETAIRETIEETGYQVYPLEYLGSLSYPIKNALKEVHYWQMYPKGQNSFIPNEEIDRIYWASFDTLLKYLTYMNEFDFIRAIYMRLHKSSIDS